MIDNRFPWIVRALSAPIDQQDREALEALFNGVSKRTGRHLAYNTRSRSIHIWWKSIDEGLGYPFPLFRKDNTLKLPTEDDICQTIWLGQVPMKVKDRWLEESKREQEHQNKKMMEKKEEQVEQETKGHLRYAQARSGMSSHYRPSVLVNGTKGV